MNSIIVDSTEPLTLVGAGQSSVAELALARKLAPDVVAVDGGAALCVAAEIIPQAIIGDLDSLDQETRTAGDTGIIYHITEQDSTDFAKALRHTTAPIYIGVGFLGHRIDHELAVLSDCMRFRDKPILLLGAADVIFLAPRTITLPLAPGTRVSLFPLAPVSGTSTGLEWPINGLTLAPGGPIGTSNRATGQVELSIDAPHLLCILPAQCLSLAMTALMQARLWSAPAI